MRTSKATKDPFIVAIAGPSGSGKSLIAARLKNKNTEIISLDDYFKNPKTFPEVEKWKNYELPEDLDFNLLSKHLMKLKNGRTIKTTAWKQPHKSKKREKRVIKPVDKILVEGFLVLYDDELSKNFDLKIFIDVPAKIQLKRRLRRDEKGKEYIERVVIPNFAKYGLPTKKHADYVLDGRQGVERVISEAFEIIEKEYKNSN